MRVGRSAVTVFVLALAACGGDPAEPDDAHASDRGDVGASFDTGSAFDTGRDLDVATDFDGGGDVDAGTNFDSGRATDASRADATRVDATSRDAVASTDSGASACGSCTDYALAADRGPIAQPALRELSGLAASRAHPGVLYAHNDSGDTPRFFALDAMTGAALGEFAVTGARAVDWEDIDVGPCPAGSCVYLADVGDNGLARAQYTVYRVPEPNVAPGRPAGSVALAGVQALPFVYPDGPHNCEGVLVDPQSGTTYLITKVASGPSTVYRFPQPYTPGTRVTLERVKTLTLPAGGGTVITGADAHPCSNRLLVRTYDRLLEYRGAAGAGFARIFDATAVRVPVRTEVQGEAVAYFADGRGYLTASEGATVSLHVARCAAP